MALLQGGRGEIAADTHAGHAVALEVVLLQGGRGEIAADTAAALLAKFFDRSFNEAAAKSPRIHA